MAELSSLRRLERRMLDAGLHVCACMCAFMHVCGAVMVCGRECGGLNDHICLVRSM
jgi:hypothetical protein